MFYVFIIQFKQLSKKFFQSQFCTWMNHKDAALIKPLSDLCEKRECIVVVYKPSVGPINVYIRNDKMLLSRQLHITHVPVVLSHMSAPKQNS